jgi:hypothetical protein
MKIPVTRNFDNSDLIGMLTLRDDVDIPPNSVFSLGYVIEDRASDDTPTKIQVRGVSLIPDESYIRYIQEQARLANKEIDNEREEARPITPLDPTLGEVDE